GMGLRRGVDAVERGQVLGWIDGILERPVSLVDASRRLQGQAALGLRGGCMAVRMNFALQPPVRGVQSPVIQAIARLEAEKREMILRKIDHSCGPRPFRERRE